MKLYGLPRNSKMRIEFKDGFHECIMHRVDGKYSYCTVEDLPEKPVFHLSAMTPMKEVDGHWEIGEQTPKQEA